VCSKSLKCYREYKIYIFINIITVKLYKHEFLGYRNMGFLLVAFLIITILIIFVFIWVIILFNVTQSKALIIAGVLLIIYGNMITIMGVIIQ